MKTTPPQTIAGWFKELHHRFRILWFIKSVGTMFWIASFFSGYFWVLHNLTTEPAIMPLTALDRLVVFQPAALILYVSLWAYVSIPPAILKNFTELFAYGA